MPIDPRKAVLLDMIGQLYDQADCDRDRFASVESVHSMLAGHVTQIWVTMGRRSMEPRNKALRLALARVALAAVWAMIDLAVIDIDAEKGGPADAV